MTGAEGPKPPMPCNTTVPEHTASKGVPPGAAMSTPSSSDHAPGGTAALLGSGKVKPPLLDAWTGPDWVGPAPEPDPLGWAARAAAAAWAARTLLSWLWSDARWPRTALSCPALALRVW